MMVKPKAQNAQIMLTGRMFFLVVELELAFAKLAQ
jgi:hypothetical protein